MTMILTHKDIDPYLDRLTREPEFQPGPLTIRPTGKEWYRQQVYLEFPLGELAKDGLSCLALCGTRQPEVAPITDRDKFNAQGLEGKARVRMDLFGALMKLRDILPLHRGQIVMEKQP